MILEELSADLLSEVRQRDDGLRWEQFLRSSALPRSPSAFRGNYSGKSIPGPEVILTGVLSVLKDRFICHGNWLGGKFCTAPSVEGKFFFAGAFE